MKRLTINKILGAIENLQKTMYSNGEDDTHKGYNHVIASNKYYRVQKE